MTDLQPHTDPTGKPDRQAGTPPTTPWPGPPPQPARQLRRSRQDRMIGGVCGGVAHYLNIDPLAVRIVTLALIFAGVGVLAYVIAWIVIPSAQEGKPEAPAEPATRHRTAAVLAAALVVAGLILLGRNWMPMMHAVPFWPVLVIGAGIALALVSSRSPRDR